MLIITVSAWITIVGCTMPVPRNAAAITSRANCNASAGMNQSR